MPDNINQTNPIYTSYYDPTKYPINNPGIDPGMMNREDDRFFFPFGFGFFPGFGYGFHHFHHHDHHHFYHRED
jgi:hypothetical protein